MAKRADLHRPWASIMVRAPSHPHSELDITPAVSRAMWATDEYAIRAFRSG